MIIMFLRTHTASCRPPVKTLHIVRQTETCTRIRLPVRNSAPSAVQPPNTSRFPKPASPACQCVSLWLCVSCIRPLTVRQADTTRRWRDHRHGYASRGWQHLGSLGNTRCQQTCLKGSMHVSHQLRRTYHDTHSTLTHVGSYTALINAHK